MIDCSLTHSTLYLSQVELLQDKDPLTFTHPHEMTYRDKNNVHFVLIPGTLIYEKIKLQWYKQEEHRQAKMMSSLMQEAFDSMSVEEIEKEYGGKVQIIRKLEDVVKEDFG